MSGQDTAKASRASEELERAAAKGAQDADPAEVAEVDGRLEELLEKVDGPPAAAAPAHEEAPAAAPLEAATHAWPAVSLRTARPARQLGRRVWVRVAGVEEEIEAAIDDDVDLALVEKAIAQGDRVLVEAAADAVRVVGVVQTKAPRDIVIEADSVTIDAKREVLLRSGRAALRMRGDGDVELVGSRIATMSRGLYRLVGRVLRLN